MDNTKIKKAGFTLIEVMVVVGIFAFTAASIYGTLSAGRKSWLRGEAFVTAQQGARLALNRMAADLRLANIVTVAEDNSYVEFEVPVDADGDGVLDLISGTSIIVYGADDYPDADTDDELWEENWKIKYQIDWENGKIFRLTLDESLAEVNRETLANNIRNDTSLTNFQTETAGTGLTTEAVNITITTQIDNIQGREISPPIQITLRSRVNLRN